MEAIECETVNYKKNYNMSMLYTCYNILLGLWFGLSCCKLLIQYDVWSDSQQQKNSNTYGKFLFTTFFWWSYQKWHHSLNTNEQINA